MANVPTVLMHAICIAEADDRNLIAFCRSCARWYMIEEPPTRTQLRIKAITAVITGASLAALLLHDWGDDNVFSGIRPAVKSVLNRLLGTSPKPDSKTQDSQTSSH